MGEWGFIMGDQSCFWPNSPRTPTTMAQINLIILLCPNDMRRRRLVYGWTVTEHPNISCEAMIFI